MVSVPSGVIVYGVVPSGVMTSLPYWTSILTRWPGGKPACSSHMPAMRSHGKNVGVRQYLPGSGEDLQRMSCWTVARRSGRAGDALRSASAMNSSPCELVAVSGPYGPPPMRPALRLLAFNGAATALGVGAGLIFGETVNIGTVMTTDKAG